VRRVLACGCIVAAVVLVRQMSGQEQPASEDATSTEQPAQLSHQQTVAPSQAESDDEARRREKARRGVVAMLLLTVLLIALVLFLMVLTARRTRYRPATGERVKPTSLEDLWAQVKEDTLPEVDIERMMSEDGEGEKHPPGGDKPEQE